MTVYSRKVYSRVERAWLKESQKVLYEKVESVILKIDPVGIGFLKDEYDFEIIDIMTNLHNCKSSKDCQQLIYEVFASWFSEQLAAPILHEDVDIFGPLITGKNRYS
jgi:hypothetical protein